MLGYLFAFGLFGVLIIASGVYISLYLYHGGAVGNRRFRRLKRVQTLTVETPSEEAVAEDVVEPQNYMNIHPAEDSTARFARVAVLVFIGCILLLILLVSTFINGGLH